MWRCPACRQLNFAGQATCKCGFVYGSAAPKNPAKFTPPPLFTAAQSGRQDVRQGMWAPADTADVVDTNPLLSIWLQPRATIRHIVNTDPAMYLAVLLTLAAFFNSLDRASGRSMGDRAPMWLIIVLSLVLSPLAIPLSHLAAMIGRWSGARLGGVATKAEVRATLAWSSVPIIAGGLIFWPIQLALFGDEMFRTETPLIDNANPFLVLGTLALPLVLAVWAIFTAAKTFGEVHRFSAWRSVGSGLLVAAIIAVPVLALFAAALAVTFLL
jgi:hypothetical protein